MTKAPEAALAANFSETVAGEVQNLIHQFAKSSKDLIKEICIEIDNTNARLLVGAAKVGQLLLFLKEKLKPKKYEEALASALGWSAGIANHLLKLAPILGSFTSKQLETISSNLSMSALYKLATGRTPVEVIKTMLEKACNQEVSQKDIQVETKKYKEKQPRKEPTSWRYVGGGREYQPPKISEEAGLVVERLSKENSKPRRFLIEEAVLLLAEKFQQAALVLV